MSAPLLPRLGSTPPLSAAEKFDEWFQMGDSKEGEAEVVQQLHKVLRPFLLRRLKSDVEKSLPPKKETILKIGMSDMQVGGPPHLVPCCDCAWHAVMAPGCLVAGSQMPPAPPAPPHPTHTHPHTYTTPPIPSPQRKYYAALLQKDMDAVTGGADRSRLLNIVMQLRKCCNHP
jgi:SWI/SNF-related matrix-associated actin-dependent regulator of chromatin subfamily A member 5